MIETDGDLIPDFCLDLKAEILILRHQLNILHRKAPKRLRLSGCVYRKSRPHLINRRNRMTSSTMFQALVLLCRCRLASPFKSKSRLEAENAVLRRRPMILRRKVPGRVWLKNSDRWFLVQLYGSVREFCSRYDSPSRDAGALASGGLWPLLSALEVARKGRATPVCTENLYPNVVVMKSAKDRV